MCLSVFFGSQVVKEDEFQVWKHPKVKMRKFVDRIASVVGDEGVPMNVCAACVVINTRREVLKVFFACKIVLLILNQFTVDAFITELFVL